MWNMIKGKAKSIGMILVLALIVIGIIYFAWQHVQTKEAALQRATVLTQQQAQTVSNLQSELAISKQNAEMLADKVGAAVAGKMQPVVTFVQPAASVEAAAEKVAERINNNDGTLPKGATEKTDRTVVTPQEVTKPDGAKDWQVGIYKANNYRNWEESAGLGVHDGQVYIPLGLQRNYSKDAAIEVEIHVNKDLKVNGGEIKYVRKTNKLFFLF